MTRHSAGRPKRGRTFRQPRGMAAMLAPMAPQPPPQNSSIRIHRCVTFSSICSDPRRVTVTAQDLAGSTSVAAFSAAASTNVSMQPLFNSIRVKRIRMWQPQVALNVAPSGVLAPSTIGVYFLANGTSSFCPGWIQKKSISTTEIAHIDVKPPKDSQCSFWNFSSTAGLFKLQFDQGAVITIDFEATVGIAGGLSNSIQDLANTYTVNTDNGVLGGCPYNMPLDFNSAGYNAANVNLMPLNEGTIL